MAAAIVPKGMEMIPKTIPLETAGASSGRQSVNATGIVNAMVAPRTVLKITPPSMIAAGSSVMDAVM